MRVVIADGPPTPARVAAALALAGRPGAADEVRVLPADAPSPDAPDPGAAVVRLDDFYLPTQVIDWLAFTRRVGAVAAAPGAVAVVLDTSNPALAGPAAHAGGAVELVVCVGQALYWVEEPPPVLHFAPARLRPFHLREWGRLLVGGPLGPTPPGQPDPTAAGWGESLGNVARERHKHRPWVRFRGLVAAKIRRRLRLG